MLLKKNGYVLEQLYSPLILTTSTEHEELKFIAKNCFTRHHSYHYLGFAATQWKLSLIFSRKAWEAKAPAATDKPPKMAATLKKICVIRPSRKLIISY
ncbi:hypothetical protein NIES4072_28010 [Nostoc commune NIES-4072]|uniref:Uncharacterized protein n=1 Tax=Nostoc commune NIES-4072 TaxID=2005467 RepID=A0A2R5FTY7_NOSCO|nr:hypothetical protein NIES4070_62730 [Nostoc commune HK-02]GBG19134.1 hypothetical protein NIES4072_28010 [Nostoc commune NIES-4072]